jgi:hypothetical protein
MRATTATVRMPVCDLYGILDTGDADKASWIDWYMKTFDSKRSFTAEMYVAIDVS